MAAERPIATGRSMFGSTCAAVAVCLCLAYGFAGCLNPLTDDQPSFHDSQPDTPSAEGQSDNGNGAPGVVTPGSNLGEDMTNEPTDSPPPRGEGANPSPGDAGITDIDAGPDSGSLGQGP